MADKLITQLTPEASQRIATKLADAINLIMQADVLISSLIRREGTIDNMEPALRNWRDKARDEVMPYLQTQQALRQMK